MTLPDLIGLSIGALFTILVFSYIIGDNPLFRFTIHIFVGVSAGFAGAVALRNVVFPQLIFPVLRLIFSEAQGGDILVFVPLLLSILLLAKLSTNFSRLGNIAMAFLVGIGAAAAIGGAIIGTLLPQTQAAMGLLDLKALPEGTGMPVLIDFVGRIVALVGTLASLIYFHFGAQQQPPQSNAAPERFAFIESIGRIGHGFIAITFGVLFAGVFSAALTALIERVAFLWDYIQLFM